MTKKQKYKKFIPLYQKHFRENGSQVFLGLPDSTKRLATDAAVQIHGRTKLPPEYLLTLCTQ